MKIVYPMQLAGDKGPSEVASLEAFIDKISRLKSGSFLIGRNRIWHGGIHLSEQGGWHPSGAVRAIADGEIVAYRLATLPAKAIRSPEEGKPGDAIELYTSPSFCLVRHRYEAGEQNKNHLTFYSLYMHIACENTYNSPEAARVTVKGRHVSTYEPVAEGEPLKLKRRLSGNNPVYAKTGAEVKLLQQTPSNLHNHRDEAHDYFLVHYVDEPNSLFYIAESQLQQEYPQKPTWMSPPEGKPVRHRIPNNTWLRQTANTTAGSLGLPAGSEVVILAETQMVNLNGGPTEFRKVQVFKVGSGTVKDSASLVMTNASKGAAGWLASSKIGAELAAEPSFPVQFAEDAPVVDRSQHPIAVQAGEVIGHWGEHQIASAGGNGLELDPDRKAVHFEVFVAESDKEVLAACIHNQARVTGGQGYLLLDKPVTTYRLTNDNQHGFHNVAEFGPLMMPLAVKESDIVSHGANHFVKIRERAAATGELAGEFVLLGGDAELVSQHDWHKLGVKLVDGSHDDDGFLDKADTATDSDAPKAKEASEFFSGLYEQLVTDKDSDGTLSGDDIKAALVDAELTGKLRKLFIKHESEWVKRDAWPRLEQELIDQPKLYEYAMQVHNNMAWIDDARDILGDTKPWFIHPAGMIGLIEDKHTGCACNRDLTLEELKVLKPARDISDEKLQAYLDAFNSSFNDFSVKSCVEKAHFLAQIFHESGNLYYTKEIGGNLKSYSPWYGRGLIQITFRDNYQAYGNYVGEDFTSSDECRNKLTVAPHAVKSAYWYIYIGRPVCKTAFKNDDLLYSSFLVNGGLTHYIDRQRKVNLAIESFANPNDFIKNKEGSYEFENSEIYNIKKGALAWGLWNDIGSGKGGANNSPQKALAGYRRFLTLLEEKPFTQRELDRIWYGRRCRYWRGFVVQRIAALG
ncbi:hypothetical protein [Aeromonas simiae]|uniref:hypothetical protein n=1 Tax=Aeromonas simiae TaxID=218936 RepID=UPI00266C2F2B|nr:hypothetical protein [Aeromonas simiae]MDO2950344.1 hypothetical protein [Aeromonas simiae]MDO2954023.1 hypothetical protein [Aeromonas simiae]MDO2957766.1 hypothetical protein [Aeromonas simiae]